MTPMNGPVVTNGGILPGTSVAVYDMNVPGVLSLPLTRGVRDLRKPLGQLIVEGERIYGDGVNIAARLETLSDPGGICISGITYDQIEDKLALRYNCLGEKKVKNAPKPVRAYKVLLWPEEETKSGKQEKQTEKKQ